MPLQFWPEHLYERHRLPSNRSQGAATVAAPVDQLNGE